MKKLLLLACLAASCSFAQPQITWHRIYDTTFTSTQAFKKLYNSLIVAIQFGVIKLL
jgi:hypothetical protein